MAVKLAITISGAVSLGTFEAGALFEVMKCLEHHNSYLDPEAENRIEIDVLTGSSAGGMSAAILAHKMLFDKEALLRPYDNALYNCWVEQADLNKLLELAGDKPELSILSSNCISAIASRFIPSSIELTASSPHSACAKELKVGLTLANLNGIDYSVGIYGGDVNESLTANTPVEKGDEYLERFRTSRFVYTRYQDEFVTCFRKSLLDPQQWKNIRDAAIACGALPFAFRASELLRPKEYYLEKGATGFPDTADRYVFADGGVFNNEPLGLAKNLVDEIDPGHLSYNRLYLYIAPCAKNSCMDGKVLKASEMDVVTTGRALAKAVFNQARFQDWVVAEKMNENVLLLHARAKELIGLLQPVQSELALSPAQIRQVTAPLLNLLYRVSKKNHSWSDAPSETLEQAKSRLRRQFAEDLSAFADDRALAEAWLDIVLLLESSAHLAQKDQMKILGITADESELAGASLFALQGFFDRKLRRHDYEVGRLKSRQIIRSLGDIINHGLPPEDNDLQIASELDGLDILKAPGRQYRSLFERLVCRIYDYSTTPVIASDSVRKILTLAVGLFTRLVPFHLALVLTASIMVAVLFAAFVQSANGFHTGFVLPLPVFIRARNEHRLANQEANSACKFLQFLSVWWRRMKFLISSASKESGS